MRTCLALSVVLAVTMGRLAPSAAQESPAVTQSTASAMSGGGMGGGMYGSMGAGSVSSGTAVITPARFGGWAYPDWDNDEASVELALVIPNKEIDVATAGRIIEDLGIMSRIIEKNVLTPYGIQQTGWRDVFVGGPSQDVGPRVLFPSLGRPKPLYIGGYGATFFIRVDFPLLPPPADKTQEQPTQAQEDPVWAQTKQSLLRSRTAGAIQQGESAGQPFSQGKVESFRRSLIATMKHAANIRGLEPAEWLTFVVQGAGSPAAGSQRGRTTGTAGSERGLTTGTAWPALGGGSLGRSVMTLRATKADVDACSKGQLSPEQFEQRVQLITY
jgi:hypothetical protein